MSNVPEKEWREITLTVNVPCDVRPDSPEFEGYAIDELNRFLMKEAGLN